MGDLTLYRIRRSRKSPFGGISADLERQRLIVKLYAMRLPRAVFLAYSAPTMSKETPMKSAFAAEERALSARQFRAGCPRRASPLNP
jgi:hypothetical protein